MGSEPSTQDWELIVARDLAASLIPRGQLRRLGRPDDLSMLPDGAYAALAVGAGTDELDDMLLVPAAVRPVGGPPWHRRCRYAPLCVLGIGERGVGLWIEGPPSPGVRVVLLIDAIAAIEREADGPWRRLTVTGAGTSLTVRYDADGDASADFWTRRLRQRCAGRPEPLPGGSEPGPLTSLPPNVVPPNALRPFLLGEADAANTVGAADAPLAAAERWHSRVGPRSCLLAVTEQEIIVVNSSRALARPWNGRTRVLYVPRAAVTETAMGEAPVPGRTLRLRSAGADVRVPLPSRNLAATASRWLVRPLTPPCPDRRP